MLHLRQNPLVVTYSRLQIRSGLLANLGFAFIIGAVTLLYYFYQYEPQSDLDAPKYSLPRAEISAYMFLLFCQGVLLFFYIYSGVSRSVQNENQSGLFLQNNLSPQPTAQLILGYWLGPSLRFYLSSFLLSLCGLIIIFSSSLTLTYWLQTQVLLLTATPCFALVGILIGLATKKGRSYQSFGIIGFLGIWSFSHVGAGSVLNFIVPFYALQSISPVEFSSLPLLGKISQFTFFGYKASSFYFTLMIQGTFSFVLWKIIQNRLINYAQQSFNAKSIYVLFLCFAFFQSGLMYGDPRWGIAILYTVFLIIAGALLFVLIVPYKTVLPRLKINKSKRLQSLLQNSLPFKALVLTTISLFFLTGVASSTPQGLTWNWVFPALGFFFILMFVAFYTEICELLFANRASSLIKLGGFIYFIVPFTLTYINPKVLPLFSPLGFAGSTIDQFMSLDNISRNHSGALFFHSLVFIVMAALWVQIWRQQSRDLH